MSTPAEILALMQARKAAQKAKETPKPETPKPEAPKDEESGKPRRGRGRKAAE